VVVKCQPCFYPRLEAYGLFWLSEGHTVNHEIGIGEPRKVRRPTAVTKATKRNRPRAERNQHVSASTLPKLCPNYSAKAQRSPMYRVSYRVDVVDSPIRQQQAIGMLEICRPPRGSTDDLLKVGPVLRMDALHH